MQKAFAVRDYQAERVSVKLKMLPCCRTPGRGKSDAQKEHALFTDSRHGDARGADCPWM